MAASYNTDAVNRVTEEVSSSMHDGAAPATIDISTSRCCIRRSTTACERCISVLHSFIWGLQAFKYWQGWRWRTVSASVCSPSIVTSLVSSWLAPWLTTWKGLQAAYILLPSHDYFLSLFLAVITSEERLLLIYLSQSNFQ